MIEKIKSLKDGPTINLSNPYAKYFYKIDSVNLIIGNNGRGKTTLIKSIIRDLTETGSPIEYIAEGVNENLGIIYYTATPFHKPIKVPSRARVSFIDASKPQHDKQSFVDSSEEYLAITELLGLENSLKSIQTFDLDEISFDLARSLAATPHTHNTNRKVLSDLIEQEIRLYRSLNNKYIRLRREVLHLGSKINFQRADSAQHDADLTSSTNTLEQLAKDIIDTKQRVSDEFLRECGPTTALMFANWITAANFLKERSFIQFKQDLARGIYRSDFVRFSQSDFFNHQFGILRDEVLEFIDILDRENCGSVQRSENQIQIRVDTAHLIKSEVDRRIIENASKRGFVRIGFDDMSSGQAAIMHQMISISQSIQDLALKGKRDIVIFIDEGDLLLHLNWQREYISLLDNRLSNFKKGPNKLDSLQVVIASHSPLLASDVLRDSITTLDNETKLPSFGAPIQQIINYSFGTPSIGLIAHEAIKALDKKKTFSDEDLEIVNQIDDEFIRRHLLKKIDK